MIIFLPWRLIQELVEVHDPMMVYEVEKAVSKEENEKKNQTFLSQDCRCVY